MELSTHWDTKAAQTQFFRGSSVFQPPAQWSILAWAWGETVNSEEMLKYLSSLDSTAVALAWKGLQEAKAVVCAVQAALAVTHFYLFLSAACASPPQLNSMEYSNWNNVHLPLGLFFPSEHITSLFAK